MYGRKRYIMIMVVLFVLGTGSFFYLKNRDDENLISYTYSVNSLDLDESDPLLDLVENDETSTETGDDENISDNSESLQTTDSSTSEEDEVFTDMANDISTTDVVHVYICGHVINQDVYTLPEGSRVYEALDLAGGISSDGDQTHMDLARVLIDGESIYFPSVEEAESDFSYKKTTNSSKAISSSMDLQEASKVELNVASESQLMELTGIGESKAKAIVAYREKNQGFSSIEEIMNVNGIKEATYNTIKDDLSVDQPYSAFN